MMIAEKYVVDVGCGSDGNYSFHPFLDANVFVDRDKPTRKIGNFIIADVYHLPFGNDVFETVCCSHVLEHLDNPIKAIKELLRISKKHVIVKTPHRYSRNAKADPKHKSFFNVTWFRKTLNHLDVFYDLDVSWNKRLFFLSMPNEITIKMLKRSSL